MCEDQRIDIYSDTGFVKSIPIPAGADFLFAHGVTVDGHQQKIWATDFSGGMIFEFDFATGSVIRTFPSPVTDPIRLAYDPVTQTLWMTGYGNPRVYNATLQGTILSSFTTSGYAENKAVAIAGSGNLIVADGVAVGTAIARRPPLRSRRAELPHRAPALGHDAEPHVG